MRASPGASLEMTEALNSPFPLVGTELGGVNLGLLVATPGTVRLDLS